MTAIENISEIQKRDDPRPMGTWKDPEELQRFLTAVTDRHFLLKAFNMMLEIAIENDESPLGDCWESVIDKFEERMAEPIKPGPSDSDFKNNRW